MERYPGMAWKKVLEESGYTDVVKAYILWKQPGENRNLDKTILDYKDVVDNYVKVRLARVKKEFNHAASVGGLILKNNSGAVTANYGLREVLHDQGRFPMPM